MTKWFEAKDGRQYHRDNPVFKAGVESMEEEIKELISQIDILKCEINSLKEEDKDV